MPRRLIAIAVALAAVALPACAQRGDGHAGSAGHAGGGLISSGTHGNYSSPSRSSFAPGPQFGGGQFHGGQFESSRFTSSQRLSAVNPFNRGNDHDADDRFRYDRFRRPYHSIYTVALPYSVGWLNPGYLSYSAFAFYDSPAYAPPQAEPVDDRQPQYNPPPVQQADAPAPTYRPAYQRPHPEVPLPPEEAVTLVFKDGRPTEQIHNFLLTRTTLYVQDDQPYPIPVDQLDLAATTKLNADAGIVFKLPSPNH
ncbi:MAG: hypothetical protein M3O31_10000 [Acidobacteriota bacterium]|nr:hypothetical protein [Acidobacteriota bacterium]